MKEEGRTEEKNGAEGGKKGHFKRWWGGVTTTQRSPEAEGRMPHDMNLTLTPCFLLPIPGYEEDVEAVSSIFTVSSFQLPATVTIISLQAQISVSSGV